MTQSRFDVTSFGEMLLRLSVPSGERLEAAKHLDIFPAGAEVNVLSLLARLARDTTAGLRYGIKLASLALSQFGDMVIPNRVELLALGKIGRLTLE